MTQSITEFGSDLIRTGDLDPIYIGLTSLKLDKGQLAKWLIAYWCFYHAGVACYMAELKDQGMAEDTYWYKMVQAAENNSDRDGVRWPRSAERRHFRGEKCVKAVQFLAKKGPQDWIQELIRPLAGRNNLTETHIMERIQKWPLFGPWIAFKAADMLETCAGVPVTFSDNIGLIYKEPREALDILGEANHHSPWYVWDDLRSTFAQVDAPPLKRRKCGPQEVETILCKWKSHYRGHYRVGKDIAEVRHGLDGGWGDLAQDMLNAMPEIPQ